MISIRKFLIFVSIATITLVNFIAVLHGYRTGLANTEQLLDKQLTEKASLITAATPINSTAINNNDFIFQLFNANGDLIRQSKNAATIALALPSSGFSTTSFNGHLWRIYSAINPTSAHHVIVAERIANRYSVIESIILKSVSPMLWGLPFIALSIWIIVYLGLKPVKKLASEVNQREPENLTPISSANLPSELQPLLNATNNMFARLSESLEREKRFSGDAAHELRTPLSTMQVNLFNLKNKLPNNNENIDAMATSITRMGHLIEQLLLLYQTSSEQMRLDFERIDLYAITRDVIAENYYSISRKNIEISLEGEISPITGNVFCLTALIKNLLDNASKYTLDDGEIQVTVSIHNDIACLVIEDNGVGIPLALRHRVMERFYRANNTYAKNIPGCGLGLSIVKHVVELHKGEISLEASRFTSGLNVSIKLPLATGAGK